LDFGPVERKFIFDHFSRLPKTGLRLFPAENVSGHEGRGEGSGAEKAKERAKGLATQST
jgi:hypothetical protein